MAETATLGGRFAKLRANRPSHAVIVAYLALFVALDGSSYAAVKLSKNGVRSVHIKNGEVKRADLGRGAVDSTKVKDGSLLSTDFKPGQAGIPGATGPKGGPGPPGATGAPPPVEGWHEVGQPGEPPFGGNWHNEGSVLGSTPRATVAFYKDPFGVVHLKGYAINGTDTAPIFTLPPGYRPAQPTTFPTPYCGGLDVGPNGAVQPHASTVCPLDGWTFRAG